MTRQILLRTPRGNTAVVPVDQFAFCTGNPRNKQDLLHLLIEASKKRDIGRKRTIRCLYPDDEDDEAQEQEQHRQQQEMVLQNMLCHMEIEGNNPNHNNYHQYQYQYQQYRQHSQHNTNNTNSQTRILEDKDADFFDEEDSRSANLLSLSSSDDDEDESDDDEEDDEIMLDAQDLSTFPPRTCYRKLNHHPEWKKVPISMPPTSQLSHLGTHSMSSSLSSYNPSPRSFMVALYHQGRKVSLDRLWEWITWPSSCNTNNANCTSSPPPPQFPIYLTLSTNCRLLGGIDRQNRVGSKFGGGGVSSTQQSERERKERLRQLALESIDLAKDPYLMRNHLGTYECKLCLTLHTNESNYLAHTQGKKHQQGLAHRAHIEKLRAEKEQQQRLREEAGWKRPPGETAAATTTAATQKIRIGRPAYQVYKSRDAETQQRCLSFELHYPQIEANLQPRHRFMSAFEQKIDLPPDRRYQYLLFAADPYQTVAFKIPNEPLDREPGRFITYWDEDEKKFTLTLYFLDPKVDAAAVDAVNSTTEGNGTTTSTTTTTATTGTSKFVPAIGTK
ncbi:pre-mRNA-splicing factor SF3a complex subunit 2 Prp11 [Nitzschia inconspicua]|uniref:Pre-mRNA-splicing factor SF3a complex subunit 2 Prp11 n=1 Tax=Nitzschia inconspicua TaxID=303405 RepID=A0A9K3PD97_9STRA|nr:pre-mRNA-splicing factor SF3a complex subunit 2 Prp11 [Nitzschia inconspicua]KAG7342685.1 pre-mRNA-splicing factor SF3a complex subunit 2 Prp11 [Nitzschia inconspicua]